MSMDRKKIIDLTQPHLIPERLRQYVAHVFKTIKKYGSPDRDIQITYTVLSIVEEKLRKENIETSPLFERTRENKDHFAGLQKAAQSSQDWLSTYTYNCAQQVSIDRCNHFQFFFIYACDHELEFTDALKDLVSYFKIDCPDKESFDRAGINVERQWNIELYHSEVYNQIAVNSGKYYEAVDGVLGSELKYSLFNHHLLSLQPNESKLRPVFLADNFYIASQLEPEIWTNNIHVLLRQLTDALAEDGYTLPEDTFSGKLIPRAKEIDVSGFDSPIPKISFITRHELLRYFAASISCLGYSNKYPLGDAIWCAPVGGYTIPWWNDFSPLENRDVYVFKFNFQDRDAVLKELLELYSYLPDSEGCKTQFVLAAKQPLEHSRDNDCEILSSGELLKECAVKGMNIPESLKEKYDDYIRSIKVKSYYTDSILEPVLRRQSWMLLTGDAGVGKSYIAIALGMAIASKGSLFGDWKVRSLSNKVLYVADDEMGQETIRKRQDKLGRKYKHAENFFCRTAHHLNLLSGADLNSFNRTSEFIPSDGMLEIQSWIDEHALKGDSTLPVNVLILDHLLKLTGTMGDKKECWPFIRTWIEELNRKGIAVILLHHEFAETKKMLGTTLIANDAPARVHLQHSKNPSNGDITVELSIPKNRDGADMREAKRLVLTISKSTPTWIYDMPVNKRWKTLSDAQKENEIKQMMRDDYKIYEIADKLGVCKNTVEKFCQDQKIRKRDILER